MPPMGFGKLYGDSIILKRRFRWMFRLSADSEVIGPPEEMNCLFPFKGARPQLSWKEFDAQHVVETIYFPGKPDWKPITFILYDHCPPAKGYNHPVFKWIKQLYDPESGKYIPIEDARFKRNGKLDLYSGDGTILERWTLENCYPQTANFTELDMGSSEVVTCEVTLRYDRAYLS